MPASTGPTWRKRAVARLLGVDERAARARTAGRRRARARVSTGATQVSAGASSRDPLVARACRERGAEVGADRVLRGVVDLVRRSTARSRARRHRFAQKCGSIAATDEPLAVGAAVDVVAGVAAGEEVVARARDRRRSRGTRRRRATSARARRRRPTRRGTRPRRSRRGAPARRGSRSTACMPPPARRRSSRRAARRPAVGARVREQSRKPPTAR